MSETSLAARAAATLERTGERGPDGLRAVVGFDGFVDTILHVVDTRRSADDWTRLNRMSEFGERIRRAAGLSLNIEYVPAMEKLGGNGPILANALNSLGLSITYIGNLGSPSIHPVFADFARRATVHSIAEPGYTDAAEFDDGKIMFGKHQSLRDVNWANLTRHVPLPRLRETLAQASLVALVNWTMLPALSDVFERLLADVAPHLEGERRWAFFDLADPAKRPREDLLGVARLISRYERHFRVVFGMNLQEARQVGSVLGLDLPAEEPDAVEMHARRIRDALNISSVVIHPTAFAAAADSLGSASVAGPYTDRPKITTGAGDHFNAGFCLGRLLGADIATSLQIAVATSGYYVREARSPNAAQLAAFLRTL